MTLIYTVRVGPDVYHIFMSGSVYKNGMGWCSWPNANQALSHLMGKYECNVTLY
jgi:hypothetical protein